MNPEGELNIIYLGYGPASLIFNTIVRGGTPLADGSYRYHWSTGESTPSATVSPNVPGAYLYSLTVTDSLACEQSETISLSVIDVRCGNNLDKVEVCKVPPGNPDKAKVVCLNTVDVVNQLKNGSHLGVCSPEISNQTLWDQGITIFPNPNKGSFVVQLTELNSSWCEIKVMDRNGKVVDTKNLDAITSSQSVSFELFGALKGLYFVKVVSAEGVHMYTMLME